MTAVFLELTMSLDGFVAGPNPTLEEPLGVGGERLHEWMTATQAWRERHGEAGGEATPESEMVERELARQGALVMGRQMFGGGEGPWGDDPWQGWWGDDPPFHQQVFVVTHHAREPLAKSDTTYNFVTDGVESAIEQARAAAAERGRDVIVAGGASIAQQALRAGLLDELFLHVSPVLLGGGRRLFDEGGPLSLGLEQTEVIESPRATHLRYRVVR
jgi:dihydrofolate reductase